MSGALLSSQGDVQLGQDAYLQYPAPVLLRRANWTTATSQPGAWIVNDFNPGQSYDVATNDYQFPRRPGIKPNADVASNRKISFTVIITGSPSQIQSQLNTIMRVIKPNSLNSTDIRSDPSYQTLLLPPLMDQELAFTASSGSYVLYGRYRAAGIDKFDTVPYGHVRLQVRFETSDPYVYETVWNTQTLGNTPNVVVHPFTYPVGTMTHLVYGYWGTWIPGGEGSANLQIKMRGPALNPSLWVGTTGNFTPPHTLTYPQTVQALGVGQTYPSYQTTPFTVIFGNYFFLPEPGTSLVSIVFHMRRQVWQWVYDAPGLVSTPSNALTAGSSWFRTDVPWDMKFYPNGALDYSGPLVPMWYGATTRCDLRWQRSYWMVI